MSSKDLKAASSFGEADYNELLQQTVAVIDTSRLHLAKQLNTVAIST